jgi:hypothetical protein
MKQLKKITLLISIVTTAIPSFFYSLASYLLPIIPFIGGLILFFICLKKKKKVSSNFYIKLIALNILLWILPMLVLIGYAGIVGDLSN